MRGQLRYDGDLQMFVQVSGDPDAGRLRFLRWLAEQGRLEHDVAGPVSGPLIGLTGGSECRKAILAA